MGKVHGKEILFSVKVYILLYIYICYENTYIELFMFACSAKFAVTGFNQLI